jgi:transposase
MLRVVGMDSNPQVTFLIRTLAAALLALSPGAWAARRRDHTSAQRGVLIGLATYLFASSLVGRRRTLLWDGLPAHRSLAMAAWLRRQRSWLVVERLPGYAPELNPVEALWSNLKGVELANLAGDTLEEVTAAAERGIQRIRGAHHLAYSFLRHCGLSLW